MKEVFIVLASVGGLILVGAAVFFVIRLKSAHTFVRFEGNNDDLVWTTPELKQLKNKIDVIVPFSHEAICVIDGVADEVWRPGRYTLKKDFKYQASDLQFFFINKSVVVPIKWGTPSRFSLMDPLFEMPINLGANGEARLSVCDSKTFLYKLVGSSKGITAQQLADFFRSRISSDLIDAMANVMKKNNLSYLELSTYLKGISKLVADELKPVLNEYGINLNDFMISNVHIDDEVLETFAKDKELTRRLKERELKYKELLEMHRNDNKDALQIQLDIIKALKDDRDLTINVNKSLI